MDATVGDLLAVAERSPLVEVGFRQADGKLDAAVLVPLVSDGMVTFALPYAHRALAEAVAHWGDLVVVASDARLGLRGWEAMAARGRVELDADPAGTWFREHLLDQELRKHPPARLLADSLMARREHWWYLPRLVLRVRQLEDVWRPAPRTDPRQGVLIWAAGGLHAESVTVESTEDEHLFLAGLGQARVPTGDVACLVRHDCSFPDMEQRSRLVQRGRIEGTRLRVEDADGELELPPPKTVLARYRAAKSFEHACRRQLALTG